MPGEGTVLGMDLRTDTLRVVAGRTCLEVYRWVLGGCGSLAMWVVRTSDQLEGFLKGKI